jgi:protein gp37
MGEHSRSEWSECSWNPVRGCTKISAGCEHCYARRFAERFRGVPGHPYEKGFDLRLVPPSLDLPKHWRRARHVFVNSMSDLFHAEIPIEYLQRIFGVMGDCPRHTFRFLTKRSARLVELTAALPWSPNIWAGVTVESDTYVQRIDDLRKIDATRRFLSLEPLLSPLPNLNLDGIHWVVVCAAHQKPTTSAHEKSTRLGTRIGIAMCCG